MRNGIHIYWQRHPYIIALLTAILLSFVVWVCMPKAYTAVTKVSDEYKEVDLAIGMNMVMSKIKDATGGDNTGLNDIETYRYFLDSEDFIRSIANKQVKQKGCTYGAYLCQTDTIEAVKKHINYNYSSRHSTLTISFTDKDPLIAAEMLDSVTQQLQTSITNYRHAITAASVSNAEKNLQETSNSYFQALKAYYSFSDAHLKIATHQLRQERATLEKEKDIAMQHYKDAIEQYVRQKALMERSYCSFAVIQNNSVPLNTNEYYASYLLSFIFIALVLTKGYLLYKERRIDGFNFDLGDFFSPWSLTIVSWGAVIALYYLQGTLDKIGPKFPVCLAWWLLFFLPSSFLAYLLGRRKGHEKPNYNIPIDANMWLFHFLFVLSIGMTLAYAHTIWTVVTQFDTDNILYNTRLLAIFEDLNHGFLNYTHGLNYALFFVGIWLYPRISKYQLAIIFILNIIIELAMMEKSGILIMILGTLFVLYEREKISKRSITLTLSFTVLFFFFFNMAKEDADSDNSASFVDFLGMYVTSPIVAFDHLRETITDSYAPNTFNYIYPYINKLGFNFQSIERLQEFVFVPVSTNVYTIMQPFYNDFGTTGVAFFGFAYGSLFGYAYLKFREGNVLFRCLYIYLVEVIIIQFYNENLLQSFFLAAEAALFVALLTQKSVNLSINMKRAL